MRRENSDFKTNFVTSPGDFKINKDYFAHVELDDYVCWVLADGLDSANDVLSSEIVVNSILSDFTEKPSLKKRKIKKYIKNANQKLAEASRTMSLQSTVLVVVSDYHAIRWGYVGNTRLYHLRKEKIKSRTKDHSIAQMMLEVGDINQQELNQHQERNNLNKYLGKDKRVKPQVSKKVELADDDILVLCTSGFWETIADLEIESDLGDIKKPQELVDNLETKMLSNKMSDLDNYSIVAIFANKVLKEGIAKKNFSIKKIAMILIPILCLSGGVLMYNSRVSKIRSKVMAARSKYNRANRLIKKGQGRQAKPELEEERDNMEKLGKDEEVAKIDKQLELIDAQELEQKGDKKSQNNEYSLALSDYKEAKLIYLKVGDYNLKEIENKIFVTTRILKAKDYEREGLASYNSGSYNAAKQEYNLALNIYKECNLSEKVAAMNVKMEEVEKKIAQDSQSSQFNELKAEANEYLKMGKYNDAINKYIEAKVICSNLGLSEEVAKINDKIKEINNRSTIMQAEEYEESAAVELNKQNFSEALFNYKQAEKAYSKYGLSNEIAKVRKKIKSVKIAKSLNDAETLEDLGDEQFDNQKYDRALESYEQVQEIYEEAKLFGKIDKVKEKISSVEKAKTINQAKEYEKLGDEFSRDEKYDKAVKNYQQAKRIYNKVDKGQDFNRIQEKIDKANDEQKGFLARLFS
ncbi:MAG: protein phosphatase 2C domain-containing protein [Bacillota bacterium]